MRGVEGVKEGAAMGAMKGAVGKVVTVELKVFGGGVRGDG